MKCSPTFSIRGNKLNIAISPSLTHSIQEALAHKISSVFQQQHLSSTTNGAFQFWHIYIMIKKLDTQSARMIFEADYRFLTSPNFNAITKTCYVISLATWHLWPQETKPHFIFGFCNKKKRSTYCVSWLVSKCKLFKTHLKTWYWLLKSYFKSLVENQVFLLWSLILFEVISLLQAERKIIAHEPVHVCKEIAAQISKQKQVRKYESKNCHVCTWHIIIIYFE